MNAEGPYREASPPPKSKLEVAIDDGAKHIDHLLRRSSAPFLTKGEHGQIQRDLEDARREHRELIHRFEDADLHQRLITAHARLIVDLAKKVRELAGPVDQNAMIQDPQARTRILRGYLDALERLNIFVTDPANLVTLDGSDVTCVDCVCTWLDPTAPPCRKHPPKGAP